MIAKQYFLHLDGEDHVKLKSDKNNQRETTNYYFKKRHQNINFLHFAVPHAHSPP